jgi:hypothetical protein
VATRIAGRKEEFLAEAQSSRRKPRDTPEFEYFGCGYAAPDSSVFVDLIVSREMSGMVSPTRQRAVSWPESPTVGPAQQAKADGFT